MITLKLSDVQVGSVRPVTIWSNSEQKNIEVDPLEKFLARLDDRQINWMKGSIESQSLFYENSNIPENSEVYHKNFLEYLEYCWGNHLGVVIKPDIIWHILLCELSLIVKSDSEKYRHIFTTSNEKKEITVISGDLITMPVVDLFNLLKKEIPTNTDDFLPEFTTSGIRSRHAFYTSFCDMCSPFYDYSMKMCGIPLIDVQGTSEDYLLMSQKWNNLSKLFTNHKVYMNKVQKTLDDCFANLSNVSWWTEMFKLEECGSGHQVEIFGWITDLFLKTPEIRYSKNFSSCVSSFDYTQLDTGKKYKMQDGLFFSRKEEDFLVPNFGFTVHEKR
jgi:hypothetical protein